MNRSTLLINQNVNFNVKRNWVARLSRCSVAHCDNPKPFSELPRIPSLPLIGSLWNSLPYIGRYDLRRSRDSAIKMYRDNGPIVREDISWYAHRVRVFKPEDIESVFRQEGKYPKRETLLSLKNYMMENRDKLSHVGLFHANDQDWQCLRSTVQQHTMKPNIILSHLSQMDQVSLELRDNINRLRDSNSQVPNFSEHLNKWALESLGLFVFGVKLGGMGVNSNPEADKLIANVNEMFNLIYKLEFGYLQLWRWFRTPTYARFHKVLSYVTSVAQKYLDETKNRIRQQEPKEVGSSFIECLLRQEIDEKIILVAINDMLLAGIDSTSTTVAFFLYHMARYPNYQTKLAEELKNLLPTKDCPIPEDYSNRVPFLKCCLKESMRLNQASRSIQRILTQDCVINGYKIPSGTQMVLETSAACSLEENFDNPDIFKPERWTPSHDGKPIHPFVFLPFGFGPRSCVGRRLSEQEIHNVIIRIFRNFRVEYHYEDINSRTKFVNFPDKPLKFQFYDI